MRSIFLYAVAALTAALGAGFAQATTLSGDLTVDNAFYAYVSTNPSVLGTLVASGNNWMSNVTLPSTALTPGKTNYLQIEAINYGLWGGFIGDFSLSGSGFRFANGSQSLVTNTANWLGIYNDSNSDPSTPQAWVEPTGSVVSQGPLVSYPWDVVCPGCNTGIDPSADWIWPSNAFWPGKYGDPTYGACQYCTVDLSTAITPVAAPEPATLPLLATGLAGFILVRRRRNRSLVRAS